ncbi:MAG TPA: right-handed parallel beta-helix repeat-containing protein [Vicinamibacterales bacterium]
MPATRTWVSGVGNDADPGSRTAPCKTFAGAISKTADGGEIDVLDPGGFGALTITKSIVLDGTGTFASVLASGTTGIIINGAGIIVRIRGLAINGAGGGLTGIRIVAADKVHLEDCQIFGFTGSGAASHGINDQRTAGGKLFVTNCSIRNNSGTGVVLLPSAGSTAIQAFLSNVRLEANGNSGLAASTGSRVSIRSSFICANTNFGLYANSTAGTAELNAENCLVVGNGQGVFADAGSTIRISNLHVANNNTGLAGAGAFVTHGNNRIAGNGAGNSVPGAPAPIGPQ